MKKRYVCTHVIWALVQACLVYQATPLVLSLFLSQLEEDNVSSVHASLSTSGSLEV